jgi:hypothetical protein
MRASKIHKRTITTSSRLLTISIGSQKSLVSRILFCDFYVKIMMASYLYFISKIVDCIDTVSAMRNIFGISIQNEHNTNCFIIFFLLMKIVIALRKKSNQITFLHVFHHSSMIFVVWIGTRYVAGGNS